VGTVNAFLAKSYGFSGVMLRSAGCAWDLRKCAPYEAYKKTTFKVPIGVFGDCYDRYLIRVLEMYASLNILKQCLEALEGGPVSLEESKEVMLTSMEGIIQHFKKYSSGLELPKQVSYAAVESPKGEFGVFLISNDSSKPYRCKIRSPGFFHLSSLSFLSCGHFLADVVTIIGSLDIVFGEIDR